MRPHPSRHSCLLRRSQRDPTAFASVYDARVLGVLSFLAARTLDVEAARDLTAETFAIAFRDRRRFRGTTEEEAGAWLFGIARNLLSHYARSGVIERKATQRLGIQLPALTDGDYERVEQLAGLDDARARVAAELRQLPPDQQEAIQMRVVDERSYAEIASRLAVSEPTVRARVSRGLRQLGVALERHPSIKETLT